MAMSREQARAIFLSLLMVLSVLSTVGAGLSGAQTTSTDAETITGELTYEDGTAVGNWSVQAHNYDQHNLTTTDTGGNFSLDLNASDEVVVWHEQFHPSKTAAENYPRDGKVDIWALGVLNTSAGEDLGPATVPNGSVLEVKVTDSNGDPISNANVRVTHLGDGRASVEGMTNNNGYLVLDRNDITGLEITGTVRVEVHGPSGYGDDFAEFTVDSDTTHHVTLEETITVNGNVTDSDGNAAGGVEVIYSNSNTWRNGNTGSDGVFSLEVPANDSYVVETRQEGSSSVESFADDGVPDVYVVGTRSVGGTNETQDISLPKGNDFQIKVVDPDGNPVSGVDVYVHHRKNDHHSGLPGSTNSNGEFVIDGASTPGIEVNGTVIVEVSDTADGNLTGTVEEYTVTSNESVVIQMTETVVVDGQVTDSNGTGVANATIQFDPQTDGVDHTGTQTASDGTFAAQVAQNATYQMEFTQRHWDDSVTNYPKDGVPDVHPMGEITTGTQNKSLGTTSLPDANRLNLTVVDPNGDPVGGADVYIQVHGQESSAFVHGQTTSSGELLLAGADAVGLEAVGDVEIYVEPGDSHTSAYEQLTLDSDQWLTLTVEPTMNVSVSVNEPDGSAAVDERIEADGVDHTYRGDTNWTDSGGNTTLAVAENGEFEVAFIQVAAAGEYQASFPQDGVPDVYAIGTVNNTTKDMGTVTLPTPHNLTVEVVDSDGNPVEAVVHFGHWNNDASEWARQETGSDGVATAELVGTANIHVEPLNDTYSTNGTEIQVDSDRTLTIVVGETVPITGQIKNPDGTNASGRHVDAFGQGGDNAPTSSDGFFELRVEPDATYALAYKQTDWGGEKPDFPKDGIPDLHTFGFVSVDSSGTDVGTKQLPDGHLVNVTVENQSGATVSGLELDVWSVAGEARGHHGATTNADGELVLDGATQPGVEVNGTLRVRVEQSEEYAATVTEVNVTDRRNVTIVVEEPATVSGQVVYPDGSTHANDTVVTFGDEFGEGSLVINRTDDTGNFSLTTVRSSDVDVQFYQSDGDFEDAFPRDGVVDIYAVERVNTSTGDVDVGQQQLPNGHVVNVTVLDESGNPVENATVSISHTQGSFDERDGADAGWAGAPTNADGMMVLTQNDSQPPGAELAGNVSIEVRPPQDADIYLDKKYVKNITVDSKRNLTFTLEEKGSVSGQLVDSNGSVPNHTLVGLVSDDSGVLPKSLDSNGNFSLHVPEPGTYSVTAIQANGSGGVLFPRDGVTDLYALTTADVGNDTVSVGQQTMPDAAGILNVKVVDESGDPVEDARVGFIADQTGIHHPPLGNLTDSAGYFVAEGERGLEANGSYVIQVKPPENNTRFQDGEYVRNVTVTGDQTVEVTLEEKPSVSGQFVDSSGVGLSSDFAVVKNAENFTVAPTNGTGHFSKQVPENGTYSVGFVQQNDSNGDLFPRDGVTDLYTATSVQLENETDIGAVTVPDSAGLLDIKVVDEDGNAVENASVSIQTKQVTDVEGVGFLGRTDQGGYFALNGTRGLEANGTYVITVEPPADNSRFENQTITREVTVTNDTSETFELSEQPAVSGQFVDSNGTGLSDDLAVVKNADNWATSFADGSGNFSTDVPTNGTYSVGYVQRNDSGHYLPRDGVTDLYEATEVQVENQTELGKLTIPDAAGILDIQVVDADGNGVENASVSIWTAQAPDAEGVGFILDTDADGYTDLDGIRGIEATGTYRIEVSPPSNDSRFKDETITREVTVTNDTTVTVQLSQQPTVSGQVVDSSNSGLSTAQVAIASASDLHGPAALNDTGYFAQDVPENASYEVVVAQVNNSADIFFPRDGVTDLYAVTTVDVGTNDTTVDTQTVPDAAGTLDIKVVNQDGEPIEDARVGIGTNQTGTPVPIIGNLTDSQGYFVAGGERGVEANGAYIVAAAPPENDSRFESNLLVTENVTVTGNQTVTLTLPEKRPNITVDYEVASTEVAEGENASVTVTVTNDGNATGNQSITLTVENATTEAVNDTTTVEVGPNETKTLNASGPLDVGTWEVQVNDLAPTTVNVRKPVSVSVNAPKQMGLGQNETVTVVVGNVDGGVGVADLNVSVANGTVAETVAVTTTIQGNDDSQIVSPTTARAIAFDGDTPDTGDVVVAEVTINATAVGTTSITVESNSLGDENGTGYLVDNTSSDSVEVVPVPVVGNYTSTPNDLDGNGTYEDVNGDGLFDLNDVQALFANSDGETVNQYPEAFDFNGNGVFDIVDVQALYNMYKESGGW